MKKIALICIGILFAQSLFAQTKSKPLYDEKVDAVKQIVTACDNAAKADKYVLCQVGGNWCPWCKRFALFVESDTAVNKIVSDNFVYIHVNYSKENKNPKAMSMLHNPARFGFPVLVILDGDRNVLHIQNSAYLEEENNYSATKVLDFFKQWTPEAVKTLK